MPIRVSHVSAEREVASATPEAPLRKILVAVNRLESDGPTLRYAAELAAEFGAAVRVVHIREREVYSGHRFVLESAEAAAHLVDQALLSFQAAGVAATGHVRAALVGKEGANIVDEALQWGADTIVLGPGPRRSWRRLFGLGVRGQVLAMSKTPVIVAPAPSARRAGQVPEQEAKRAHERHAA